MDRLAEGTGALAVDDADALQVGHAGFVQVFVQAVDGVVRGQTQEVELGRDGGAAGQVHVLPGRGGPVRIAEGALDGAAGGFTGAADRIAVGIQHVAHGVLRDEPQVRQIDLALQDAAADIDLVVAVREGTDGTGQAHGDDADPIADMEVAGAELPAGGNFLFGGGRLGALLVDLVADGCAGALHGGQIAPLSAALGGLAQVGDGLVGLLLGLLQDFSGILVGLLEQFLPALLELLLAVPQGLAVLLQGGPQAGGLLLLGAQLLTGGLQVGQEILEVLLLLAELFLCSFDDVVGQAQLLGDGEGVALARDADHEPVGGLEGLDIELTAGVHDALGPHGVGLELGVVGRRQGADVAHMAEIQDRDGQGRALGRVGAGAQLIEEAQALAVDAAEDVHDGLHMGGEGGQTLLDALLVADVGKDIAEEGELAPVTCRNVESRHAHQLEEADRLERDRLAARVGAGDDDHIVFAAQLDIDGHDRLVVDQGMPPLADMDVVFVVEDGPGRILLHGQVGAGKNEIQLRHILRVVLELHEVLARLRRQGGQDLLDLLFLLQGQLAQAVVEGDDGSGLNEEGRARGGLVVDQARHLRLVLRLDGNAVAVAAQGDHAVLQIGRIGRVDHLRQLLVDPVPGLLDLPPDLAQGGGGVIRHLFLGDDAAADLRRQARHRIKAVKKVVEDIHGLFLCFRTMCALCVPGIS